MRVAIDDRDVELSWPDRHPIEWLTLVWFALAGVLTAGMLWEVVV